MNAAEIVAELNSLAVVTDGHSPSCLCPDCRRFCDLSDVWMASGAASCPSGGCGAD